jgi:hypothetical protein
VLDFVGGDPEGRARRRLIATAVATATPTALTGLNDWAEEEDTDAGVRRAGVVHALSNSTALMLYAGSLTGGRGRGVALRLVGAAALGAGAYLGGHLSFVKGVGVDVSEPTRRGARRVRSVGARAPRSRETGWSRQAWGLLRLGGRSRYSQRRRAPVAADGPRYDLTPKVASP